MARARPAGTPRSGPDPDKAGGRAPRPIPVAHGLDTPIGLSGLPGAATLRRRGSRLGIRDVRDLLTHLPRRYEDLRAVIRVADVRNATPGTSVTVRATVVSLRVEPTFRRRVQRTIALLRDESGELEAVWFGRRYIERRLHEGDRIVASGKVRDRGWRPVLDGPEFGPDDGSALLHAGRIVPVYPLTEGLTARLLRSAIRAALDRYGPYPEYLPPAHRRGLPGIDEAVEQAHFPPGFDQRDGALLRLAHDELLALQLGMIARRRQRTATAGQAVRVDPGIDQELRRAIGGALSRRMGTEVELTSDQAAAMDAIRADMTSTVPMLRLIQGDVGSGKTAVAAYALGLAARSGGQGALLAPTDLLARQLVDAVGDLLGDQDVAVTLLTGSLSAAGRRAALDAISTGRAGAVVGTHALLGEHVAFTRLDLVVIDEQHRFGVAQREALAAKGTMPHVLLMTATPIPRTMGQVLYADLDVSDMRTPPAGRQPVHTGIRTPTDLAHTWQRVREEAASGHRTFVVVPHIDPADALDGGPGSAPVADSSQDARPGPDDPFAALAAEEVAVHLRGHLAPLRVGMVHGRMPARDRDAEMSRFRDGALDVLVGTTVVEVGVDVPEATMMIVLSADRFGLSQLHQLRGRVGRGSSESFCVLVSEADRDSTAAARLRTILATRDGFALAEADLDLRREGDVLGLSQSGLPRLRVASLARRDHRELAVACRAIADQLVDERGELVEGLDGLRAELTTGWLADVAAGEAFIEESVGA